ncbi:hypothetical protein ARMGADRAFT_1028989 [Armillaria gallica]|uniref:Uncharacterized protein n=1 Tax=Armillaria gallica TaxID=47427 RepID=A0A2H3DZQ5_ARMGA|nr:hypothetical protein ARMGADRAFT_1028989 [Armillaria gallica]
MHGADATSSSQVIPDAAQLSQPGKTWCKTHNDTRGGAVVAKATRMNYYHPYLWMHIDQWTAHGKKKWSEKTLLNVWNWTVLEGSGCTGILAGYKDIQDAINTALQKLIVNVDQVGVWLLPNNSYTFHEKGAHQVDMVVKDEKQCYTALTANMASGAFLC